MPKDSVKSDTTVRADTECATINMFFQTASISVPALHRLAVISLGGRQGTAALSKLINLLDPTSFFYALPMLLSKAGNIF